MPKIRYMSRPRKDPDKTTYSGRFAIRLRRLREDAGLTQEQIATSLGVTVTTYYRWESGENFPKADLLPIISKALGLKKTRTLMPED
jgi:transcriptional regulator with XRE-family HTH domain